MNVIVTGHKGYIGRVLVSKLVDQGIKVLGMDVGLYKPFEFPRETPDINEKEIDVRSVTPAHLENCDAIIHLAALSNDPMGELDPGLTDAINFRASARLADLAKKAGIGRFIFSSSCSIYGRTEKEKELSETDPTGPITEYAKSKLKFENYLKSIADDSFSPVMMRNSTVYGFSPSFRMDLVVNDLTGWGYFTNKINILSDGRPWRPLIHVQDLSNMFIKMIKVPREKIHNQIFNIGFNEENYRIKQIAEIIRDVIPNTEVTIAKSFDPDSRSYRVNFDKLQQTINTKKEWNVKKGAEELYQFFKKGLISKSDFMDKKYARLNQLKSFRRDNKSFFETKI
ncbi:MAG: NAD-dependent epimerase/dehydratase family protein [Promethearchaeota archaeon]